MRTQVTAFHRAFPDGRTRNVWAVGNEAGSTVQTFTRANGDRLVQGSVESCDLPRMIAERLSAGYLPLGVFEIENAVLGARLGDVDPAMLMQVQKVEDISHSPINLYFRADGLQAGWPWQLVSMIEPYASCDVGENHISFMGLSIGADGAGKTQGILRVGHGLLCTLLFLSLARRIGGFHVSDVNEEEVCLQILHHERAHLEVFACSDEELSRLGGELGFAPPLYKQLESAGGGLPVFTF